MCKDSDLFGDIIVTFQDVEIWLNQTAPYISKLRWKDYIKSYDVTNKIKQSKLNGSFEKLINEFEAAHGVENIADFFPTNYAEIRPPWKRRPCPDHKHKCGFLDCKYFLKYRKSIYDHNRYIAKKKKAAKAASISAKNNQLLGLKYTGSVTGATAAT